MSADPTAGTTGQAAPDLDAIEEKWLRQCAAHDAGMAMSCTCPEGDPRNVIDALVTEVRTLRRAATYDVEREHLQWLAKCLGETQEVLNVPGRLPALAPADVPARVRALLAENARLRQERNEARKLATARDERLAEACADVAGWLRLPPNPDDPIGWADVQAAIAHMHRRLATVAEVEEFRSWLAKAVDDTLAAIHGAPAEIAPLATPFTAGDLPRAVAAMIERVGRIIRERDNARNYAEGTDRLIREARAELHWLNRTVRLLWDATGIDPSKEPEFVADAIRGMLDSSRLLRTQIRPQLARAEADAAEARRELDRAEQNVRLLGEALARAERERNEARIELDEARAETDRVRNVYREHNAKLRAAVEALAERYERDARLVDTTQANNLHRVATELRGLPTTQPAANDAQSGSNGCDCDPLTGCPAGGHDA